MMDELSLLDVVDLVNGTAMWIVFLWLFVTEQRRHNETIKQHQTDLRDCASLRLARELHHSGDGMDESVKLN